MTPALQEIKVPTTEGVPVLASIIMRISGLIVPLNATYKPGLRVGRGGKRHATLIKTDAGEEYHQRIMSIARMALLKSQSWPKDPWQPTHVRLSTYAFNSNTDAGAANKLVADALEGDDHAGILYVDDAIVSWGESPRPTFDDGGPRLVIYAELLSLDDPEAAERRRASVLAGREKRADAKARKALREATA